MKATQEEIQLRPLGKLMNVIELAGFNIEYQYDDLVFVNNTAFIFRFDTDEATLIHIHFNDDCKLDMKTKISNQLLSLSKQESVNLVLSNNYSIENTNTEKEEFQIFFK